jgi:hypothetical protein
MRAAGRAEQEVILDSALAGGTGLLVLELLQQRLLFKRSFVQLGERVAGPQDQVDPVAREEED